MSIMWKKVEGVPFSHCDGIWGGECGCCFMHFSPWHEMGGSVELYALATLALVLIACEAGWTPQLVWKFCSRDKCFACTGF